MSTLRHRLRLRSRRIALACCNIGDGGAVVVDVGNAGVGDVDSNLVIFGFLVGLFEFYETE